MILYKHTIYSTRKDGYGNVKCTVIWVFANNPNTARRRAISYYDRYIGGRHTSEEQVFRNSQRAPYFDLKVGASQFKRGDVVLWPFEAICHWNDREIRIPTYGIDRTNAKDNTEDILAKRKGKNRDIEVIQISGVHVL